MFKPGISGNPRGRPKGTVGGRAQALATLDRLRSEHGNQQALMDALEAELQADPARFFRNIVVPLLPRAALDAPPSIPVPCSPPSSALCPQSPSPTH